MMIERDDDTKAGRTPTIINSVSFALWIRQQGHWSGTENMRLDIRTSYVISITENDDENDGA